ncbi:MAG: Lrp/AsnC family transcriptional regulator [Alphaproteobacteria bacterium]|jgi:Lrp/AsnC family transcriptional regulator
MDSGMDELDRKILRILQTDSALAVSEIAKQVGLSASPCWKRINRLREGGIIERNTVVLNARQLGFGLTVFVSIKTGEHSDEWLADFSKQVTEMPEVTEIHRMAGDVDYMLKVVARDMESFDKFYKRLIGITAFSEVTSRFSMEKIKETTALPI